LGFHPFPANWKPSLEELECLLFVTPVVWFLAVRFLAA
jgi:hypothetical protein